MIKNIKIILIFIVIAVLLGVLYLFHNLFGNNSVILSQITYDEKEEILKVIGLNNKNDKIELKKLDTPKTYKDIYYIIYFSINLNDNKYTLNSNEIVDFKYIEEKNNIIKYSATTSNMGKNIEVLDKIIDKYGK